MVAQKSISRGRKHLTIIENYSSGWDLTDVNGVCPNSQSLFFQSTVPTLKKQLPPSPTPVSVSLWQSSLFLENIGRNSSISIFVACFFQLSGCRVVQTQKAWCNKQSSVVGQWQLKRGLSTWERSMQISNKFDNCWRCWRNQFFEPDSWHLFFSSFFC